MQFGNDDQVDQLGSAYAWRRGCTIGFGVLICVSLATCCVIPSVIYHRMFKRVVVLEQRGWRFDGKYEVGFGVGTEYSDLTYFNKPFGLSLTNDVNLVTPIGHFSNGQFRWVAESSSPEVWDDDYRPPSSKETGPWVMQIKHSRDINQFLSQGFYQAPRSDRTYEMPWTNHQLIGTPDDWVYVYRVDWSDPLPNGRQSRETIGYWVDPKRLNNLEW